MGHLCEENGRELIPRITGFGIAVSPGAGRYPDSSVAADVLGLGSILFELLTGQPPRDADPSIGEPPRRARGTRRCRRISRRSAWPASTPTPPAASPTPGCWPTHSVSSSTRSSPCSSAADAARRSSPGSRSGLGRRSSTAPVAGHNRWWNPWGGRPLAIDSRADARHGPAPAPPAPGRAATRLLRVRPRPGGLSPFLKFHLFESRPEGAATCQPRAPPWESDQRVENNNALKGQNRFVVKNLVSPFQGWGDFHFGSDPQGVALGFIVSAPSGRHSEGIGSAVIGGMLRFTATPPTRHSASASLGQASRIMLQSRRASARSPRAPRQGRRGSAQSGGRREALVDEKSLP